MRKFSSNKASNGTKARKAPIDEAIAEDMASYGSRRQCSAAKDRTSKDDVQPSSDPYYLVDIDDNCIEINDESSDISSMGDDGASFYMDEPEPVLKETANKKGRAVTPAVSEVKASRPANHCICICGEEIKDDFNFCGMCGTEHTWECAECHSAKNKNKFLFCVNCGVPKAAEDSHEIVNLEDDDARDEVGSQP